LKTTKKESQQTCWLSFCLQIYSTQIVFQPSGLLKQFSNATYLRS
jgi:hypothetical protein